MTPRLITHYLIKDLQQLAKEAQHIYLIVAFAMPSGVKMLLPSLKEALAQNAELKILIGDYLCISNPEALNLLLTELPTAEIRLFQSNGISFHPKAYLFKNSFKTDVIVGSSNLSKSALTTGIEWNLHASAQQSHELFEEAIQSFMEQFLAIQTVPLNPFTLNNYREQYLAFQKKMPYLTTLSTDEEIITMFGENLPHDQIADETDLYDVLPTCIEPRPAQQLALKALEQTKDEEYTKALVVLATGLGKTYLAAFFAQNYQRVLFIAHRSEILQQAQQAFFHVNPEKSFGFYNGERKEQACDYTFASIYTLGTSYHLNQFSPHDFDLIVIDEFHHAVAQTYDRVLSYFTPNFLLGITATPDRLDNKDVYSLCDGNVAISIHFLEAIRKNWLTPFQYFGVYDDTDYSHLSWRNNRYDSAQLEAVQLKNDLATSIFEKWLELKQTRTIGFCSSVTQAQFLAQFFSEQGVKAYSVHGQTPSQERHLYKRKLEEGNIDILFTVDLYNEGVDIPSVDTLLFVRPTESLTIFTQQIGRGLRLSPNKTHCVIIDFIGNYRNADLKLQVFMEEPRTRPTLQEITTDLPSTCSFHLDLKVIDLVKELTKKYAPRKEQAFQEYRRLKLELGKRPTLLQFHLQASIDSRIIQQEFGSYIGFLATLEELTPLEENIWATHKDWLEEISKTSMTKSYKMVVLHCLLQETSNWLQPHDLKQLAPLFHTFFMEKEYRRKIDFSDKRTSALHIYDEKKITQLIRTMPIDKWSKSAPHFIRYSRENDTVQLLLELNSSDEENILYHWTKQIGDYRLHSYFERKAMKL